MTKDHKKPSKPTRKSQKASSSSSNGSGNHVQKVHQLLPMVKANINVSTGGTTYNNPTSSSTFSASGATNVTSDPCFATYFTLGDLPQVSQFTAIYDQYRIRKIDVIFTPLLNVNTSQSAAVALTAPEMNMYYLIDYDDANVISPLTTLMEYETCKVHNFYQGALSLSFKPHVALAAYSGVFSSYANVQDQWLDTGSIAIQHFGVKWGFPCPINTNYGTCPVALTCRYHVEFKNIR
jgi:hypothetical protein